MSAHPHPAGLKQVVDNRSGRTLSRRVGKALRAADAGVSDITGKGHNGKQMPQGAKAPVAKRTARQPRRGERACMEQGTT